AYVSLAVTDGHGAPTWVAGLALTGATLTWTAGAWLQERLVRRRGPRWLVRRGMAVLAVGIAATLVGLGDVPVAVIVVGWTIGGLGIGLSYAPITVTVLGAAAAGEEGAASASLQLTDVLGVAVGTGVVGAFVALGDGRGWATTSSLGIAFVATLLMAAAGVLAAARLPRRLPGVDDAGAGAATWAGRWGGAPGPSGPGRLVQVLVDRPVQVVDLLADLAHGQLLRVPLGHEALAAEGLDRVAVDAGLGDLGHGRLARLGAHDVGDLRFAGAQVLLGALVGALSDVGLDRRERRGHGRED